MPNAANLTADSRFMALFVGPKSSGKTCAACSWPGRKRVLDFDGRIRGILGAPWIDKSLVDYDYYPPKLLKDQKPTYVKINEDLEALLVQVKVGQCPYSMVTLDSLTSETFAMLCDSVPLTHKDNKGKSIGQAMIIGPDDYMFEATNTYNILAYLRSLPLNVIVSAHVVDRYGKADPDNPYSESVVVGQKLSLRDKIGENIGIYFDHVFSFKKREVGGQVRHFAKFRGILETTTFPELPEGEVDITGKNFYELVMSYVKGSNNK